MDLLNHLILNLRKVGHLVEESDQDQYFKYINRCKRLRKAAPIVNIKKIEKLFFHASNWIMVRDELYYALYPTSEEAPQSVLVTKIQPLRRGPSKRPRDGNPTSEKRPTKRPRS